MPKVSVLMPVYRTKESYLRTAIESILDQTFTDFEFLILDDCPNDSREEIVKSYDDPRIKYIKNEKNMGITPSRNKLIDLAQGEYLAVMDHDDISLPERFRKQVDFLDHHQAYGVVSVWADSFPKYLDLHRPEKDLDIKTSMMAHCGMTHPASMIRKSVLTDNHLHYEEEFSPCEDYRLWIRLMDLTKFYNIPEVLFRYRFHDENTTSNQFDKMLDISERLHYEVQKTHPELYVRFKSLKKKYFNFLCFKKQPFLSFCKFGKNRIFSLLNKEIYGGTR